MGSCWCGCLTTTQTRSSKGYLEAEWGDEEAEPSLYLLLEQSTGKRLFPDGVTIGQIEDFLTSEAQPTP